MAGVRVFVGNLPYKVTERELRDLLERAGRVESVSMPLDRLTGRPRGFAIVEAADDAAAGRIIGEFNGYVLDGRQLKVEYAREREAVHPAPRYRYKARPGGRPEVRPHRPERPPGR
jgi:nucleolin